MVIPGIFRH